MKILTSIYHFIKYVFLTIMLPINIAMLVYEYIRFRSYITILKQVINNNVEFFEFLERYKFMPDWLGRMYSPQTIPKEFSDFNDDELYDITMRSLLPMNKIIERNVLVDVVGITINRIDKDIYIICLTPHNQKILFTYLKTTIISVILYSITCVLYFLSII